MHGNVREWVWDLYAPYPDSASFNPTGPESGTERVTRGGAWSDEAARCRSASRSAGQPGLRSAAIGFRPVRNAGIAGLALPEALDFGEVLQGESSTLDLLIQNQGLSPLEISGISAPPGFTGAWSGRVEPGATQTVPLRFTPTEAGEYAGVLEVQSAGMAGARAVFVSGSGVLDPEAGGGAAGELFSTDFGVRIPAELATWGNPAPSRQSDPDALNGWGLRYSFHSGYENFNGAALSHNIAFPPGGRKRMFCRIRFKLGPNANINGIQKILRFRGVVNGVTERPMGTLNIQWGDFLFFGDNYGNGQNHTQIPSTKQTHGPQTFRDQYRWLEFMVDYSDPSRQAFKAWVDGTLVLEGSVNLNPPMPANLNMNYIMFLGTYNEPAATRQDWIDRIDVSDEYMGVPLLPLR